MSRPAVSDAAERLYATLGAYTTQDEAADAWVLLHMCEASALMLAKANDALRYDDTGSGWRRMRDPERAPSWALPWLAQQAGIRELPTSLAEAEQRALIRDAPGLRRGTVGALRAAAQRYLTGNKTVVVVERHDGAAYQFTVVTRTDETDDPDQVLAALVTQKPAGLILTHVVSSAQILDEVGTEIDDVPGGVSIDDVATTSI